MRLFYVFLSCFSLLYASAQGGDLSKIDVEITDVAGFPGNWSLASEEVYYALKHCTYEGKLKILEFGAGDGTVRLASLLRRKGIPYEYHSFESDASYIKNIQGVQFHKYELSKVAWSQVRRWVSEVEQIARAIPLL